MSKPLKYKIEIQLSRSTGVAKPPKEVYYDDSVKTALYYYHQFSDVAETREISEWDGKKYVKINSLKLEKCGV